jgi:hypothetical protein
MIDNNEERSIQVRGSSGTSAIAAMLRIFAADRNASYLQHPQRVPVLFPGARLLYLFPH